MAHIAVLVEGNMRIVRAAFRVPDEDGTLTDPDTVTFSARRRGEDVVEYVFGTDAEVTRTAGVATGSFDLTLVFGEGTWYVHVQGTGAAHAAGEISFEVKRSEALANA